MSEELRAAATHIVRCTQPSAIGVAKHYPAFAQFGRLLADAYLAEHPADDGEPLTPPVSESAYPTARPAT